MWVHKLKVFFFPIQPFRLKNKPDKCLLKINYGYSNLLGQSSAIHSSKMSLAFLIFFIYEQIG